MREAARAAGFFSSSEDRITGVKVQMGDAATEIKAALIVDCSGRATALPRWLTTEGYGEVPRQELGIWMAYTSGLFRPPPDLADETWACLMLATPPGTRAAYLTPVEGGLWIATMYGRGGDTAPREAKGFVAWAEGLAHPVIHDKLSRAEVASRFWTYKIPKGTWSRYDRMERFPEGLIPMGEALTSFNPMYGQGISLSAGQARALRDAIVDGTEYLAPRYFAGCEALNQVGWSVMETRDLEHASTTGPRPADLEDRWSMGAAIRRLAETDSEIHRLSVRVTHLLDPPSVLTRQDIVNRARRLN